MVTIRGPFQRGRRYLKKEMRDSVATMIAVTLKE